MKALPGIIAKFLREWVLLPVLCTFLVWSLKETEFIRYLRNAVELAIDFKVRLNSGKEPAVSPKLKIIIFDDKSSEVIDSPELPDDYFKDLMAALQEQKPALILADKIFSFEIPESDIRDSYKELASGLTPIGAGAVFNGNPHGERPQLDLTRPEFQPNFYASKDGSEPGNWTPGWVPEKTGFVYGPHSSVLSAFKKVGHITYFENGEFEPVLHLKDNRVLPHLSLYAGKDVSMNGSGLFVDGKKVPVVNGKTLINFVSRPLLDKQSFSMAPILKVFEKGKKPRISFVEQGDVVLILPLGATGNGDLYDSPLGRMRGGHILAAEINSFMTNQWLTTWHTTELYVFAAAFLGLVLGRIGNSILFGLVASSSAAVIAGCGLLVFSFFALDVPWLFPCLTFVVCSVINHLVTVFRQEIRTRVFKQALYRLISEEKVTRLARNPGAITLTPQEQVITIMFFDLVGFSLTSETRTPQEIFKALKSYLNVICNCVYDYGGMVDKIVGDGALCLFGYSLEKSRHSGDHAEQAVFCAQAIQTRVLEKNLSSEPGSPIFPVRIGIHSASAFMGDLGGNGKIEFTVIGQGVNFARRLEEASEPYKIMISSATRELLTTGLDEFRMVRRDVSIKHHSRLFEAYEIDVFWKHTELLQEGLKQYTTAVGRRREEDRHLLPFERRYPVYFSEGQAFVQDFSKSGMRIESLFYVSKGTQMTMQFEAHDCPVHAELLKHLLSQIQVVVMWGRPIAGDRFALGIQFIGMSQLQRAALVNILSLKPADYTNPERNLSAS